ncbi:MAG: tRNA uridine-5-carboxymethylaminomethyl(34) synthesis GTPase MnmE [Tissierellales bacterium]|nr:tRNA uridine-5-carboxymethylaminomethyl(34) synthesis GTPase MnmE [Tissierellales bacterium]MBN2827210.1 tRNA uridine-5-carboxymethylaminomethyl(34) synthesis GTPase MnmE [Tissierellales bacterium]
MINDTIAASATSPGLSGIGIIRLSGIEAIDIAEKLFKSKSRKKLSELEDRKLNYGWMIDPLTNAILDEVLVVYMRSPKTYTREDVVEINCHGGIVSTERILNLLVSNGVRLAERGEFTKRAFMNGRLDLTQAEAVMDLVGARTQNSFDISFHQLEGRLSKEINHIRKKLMDMTAQIEVNIDFPEYDEEQMTVVNIESISREIVYKIDKLIQSSETGKIYKEGIRTLILGKPNVGKSSLMNYLLNENRSIVTDIPGTTRDTIEEYINLAGIPLKIIDTAGIRNTQDEVEKIGVKKALDKIDMADLILMVFDASTAIESEDKMILEAIKGKNVIYLLNKTDLPEQINFEALDTIKNNIIKISIVNNEGLDKIEEKVKAEFLKGSISVENDIIVNNLRHKDLLHKARKSISEVLESIKNSATLECLQVDIINTLEYLGEITGESVKDDLIDKIFAEFCIGK